MSSPAETSGAPEKRRSSSHHYGMFMTLGLTMGVALGVAFDRLAIGIAIGVGVGVAIDSVMAGRASSRGGASDDEPRRDG